MPVFTLLSLLCLHPLLIFWANGWHTGALADAASALVPADSVTESGDVTRKNCVSRRYDDVTQLWVKEVDIGGTPIDIEDYTTSANVAANMGCSCDDSGTTCINHCSREIDAMVDSAGRSPYISMYTIWTNFGATTASGYWRWASWGVSPSDFFFRTSTDAPAHAVCLATCELRGICDATGVSPTDYPCAYPPDVATTSECDTVISEGSGMCTLPSDTCTTPGFNFPTFMCFLGLGVQYTCSEVVHCGTGYTVDCECATGYTGCGWTSGAWDQAEAVECDGTGYTGEVASGTCACTDGYTGCDWTSPNWDEPQVVECDGTGYTGDVSSGDCDCDDGYTGCGWTSPNWDEPQVVECDGTGYAGEVASGTCACADGYTGCGWTSPNWDEPQVVECDGTGYTGDVASGTCACADGYTGCGWTSPNWDEAQGDFGSAAPTAVANLPMVVVSVFIALA